MILLCLFSLSQEDEYFFCMVMSWLYWWMVMRHQRILSIRVSKWKIQDSFDIFYALKSLILQIYIYLKRNIIKMLFNVLGSTRWLTLHLYSIPNLTLFDEFPLLTLLVIDMLLTVLCIFILYHLCCSLGEQYFLTHPRSFQRCSSYSSLLSILRYCLLWPELFFYPSVALYIYMHSLILTE